MSILIDEHTNVLVQGITGRIGRVQTGHMKKAGTRIVAGVTPGKGGMVVEEVPVYGSVQEAQLKHPIDASVLFVPPSVALASCLEAIDAGVKLILLITEHVPVHDTMRIRAYSKKKGARMIGPTTPGVIVPEKCKIGIMPMNLFCSGPVGIISRSGTLAYEIAGELMAAGIGQSTVVGMGADPVVGTDLPELLDLFERDGQTEIVVVVGEVGGTQEERAADFVREKMKKPVIAYIAGRTAPQGVRMGHAGAIASRGMGSAESKVRALLEAGVQVAEHPGDVPGLVKNKLKI